MPAGYQVGNTMVTTPAKPHPLCPLVTIAHYRRPSGVPAGGGAPASSDTPPPGSSTAHRHAAAPLPGGPGKEDLCQDEAGCACHPGGL